MSKRVHLSDLEIQVLLMMIDKNTSPASGWPEHALFSEDAFKKLRSKLAKDEAL